MSALATETIQYTIQKMIPLSIFERIAEKDQTAVKDCVKTYGDFIWALAEKFTASTEEAEAATREIFLDIWRYAQRTDKPPTNEEVLIALIAMRKLIKHLH